MDDLTITHVGGPTVLLEVGGWRILTDPTFDPPGRRYGFGWGTSSTKLVGPAVAMGDLGRVDLVLLSHDHHADNLDDAGRALLADVPIVVTTRPGARRLDETTGDVRGLAAWATTRVVGPGRPDLVVTATPCRHGPPLSRPVAGAVVGFALRWDDRASGAGSGPGREPVDVWVSGDTVAHDGTREVVRRLDVDVAVLHLGGVRFGLTGPLRYSMTGADAVELVAALRPRVVVPVHYEGWSHFADGRADVERAFAGAPPDVEARVRWLAHGTPTVVSAPVTG
ncbi:MBL fold metallo-hydrolase [Salsipaludibacter albus]|uniref:MBL fold metallo-hydrolase n=1 Tax=Salsipaludibacter albus TaxID=2849650 RepID=UPI001EE42527|nr:MBL fold metallo-hydrolase [Salsipaludibacter albus]MBY5163440.1 MBL fold metallo-hydrolase [Salsipaludibacter albus]